MRMEIHCPCDRRVMRLHRPVGEHPVVRNDHQRPRGADLLRLPHVGDHLVGPGPGAADEDRHPAARLIDDDLRYAPPLRRCEVHHLAGGPQREQPVHARRQQPVYVVAHGLFIHSAAPVEERDERRNDAGKSAHRGALLSGLHCGQIRGNDLTRLVRVLRRHQDVTPHARGAGNDIAVSRDLARADPDTQSGRPQRLLHGQRLHLGRRLMDAHDVRGLGQPALHCRVNSRAI